MLCMPSDHKYIVTDESGQAFIQGTRMKVRELVKNHLAYGWSPEELQWQHPFLTLAQIYAALAYYHDHQEAFDQEIREGLALADALRKKGHPSPVRKKLLKLRQR